MTDIIQSGSASFQQMQSYNYHMTLKEGDNSEVMWTEIELKDFNLQTFHKTIHLIFAENDSLRTFFSSDKSEIYQNIQKYNQDFPDYYTCLDLSNLDNPDLLVNELINGMSKEINLSNDSLLCRCHLIILGEKEYKCLFFLHHIISDLWSLAIIKERFNQLYQGFFNNIDIDINLTPFKYNMINYAEEQHENFRHSGHKIITYWHEKLKHVLTDCDPSFTSIRGVNKPFKEGGLKQLLDDGTAWSKTLKITGDDLSVTYDLLGKCKIGLSALFNAVFSLLPWYFGNNKQMLIASPINNRFNVKLKSVIGLFGGSIYSHQFIDENISINEHLTRVYFNILKSVKFAITEHDALNLDGLKLREKCDVFLNVVSKEFGHKIPLNFYTGEAMEDTKSYYSLNCGIYEQEDHLCMIWVLNKGLYTLDDICHLSNAIFEIIKQFNNKLEEPIKSVKINY